MTFISDEIFVCIESNPKNRRLVLLHRPRGAISGRVRNTTASVGDAALARGLLLFRRPLRHTVADSDTLSDNSERIIRWSW